MNVYLPIAPHVTAHIDDGSGIVGEPDGDRVLIYYEGNRFNYANVRTFADKVQIAAGRMSERYPTIARMSVEAGDVVCVGTFDGSRRISLHSDQIDNVASWIGCGVADLPIEMSVTR